MSDQMRQKQHMGTRLGSFAVSSTSVLATGCTCCQPLGVNQFDPALYPLTSFLSTFKGLL